MIVSGTEGALSVSTTGLVGISGGLGRLCLGFNGLGLYDPLLAIYQRRHKKGRTEIVRMRFYRGFNPRTTAQQAWRAVFATGLSTWQAFTTDEKRAYNERVRGKHMTGFNLFMREYLAENRL